MITSDLSWNEYVRETSIKKTSKRLYFPVQLKRGRARLSCRDLAVFYVTCIRSILVYAVPVFFYALPKYLRCELKRVQKRALSIICPILSCEEALKETGIPTIISYCNHIARKNVTMSLTPPLVTRI